MAPGYAGTTVIVFSDNLELQVPNEDSETLLQMLAATSRGDVRDQRQRPLTFTRVTTPDGVVYVNHPGRIRQRRLTPALPASPAPCAFRLGLGPVERRADLAQGLPAVALLGAEQALGASVKALRVAVVVRLSGYVPGLSFGHAPRVAKSQQSGREPEGG